ncbi:MAG: hypothetical protein IAF38_10890 [Bacteroidia bacterium]|nr:hypothetical protein [Bacteroidia bacterium]
MNNSQLDLSIKLAKSLQFGFNARLTLDSVNDFISQMTGAPPEIVLVKIEYPNGYKNDYYYDLNFILVKTVLCYNEGVNFELRLNLLKSLLNDPGRFSHAEKIKYWVRVIFADFDRYIQYNPVWEELIYLLLAQQKHKKQLIISKLIIQQFSKNFRKISSAKRFVILEKLMLNASLQNEIRLLFLKHAKFILKRQLIVFHDSICEPAHKEKIATVINKK